MSRAIRDGYLERALDRSSGKARIVSAELADQEWAANVAEQPRQLHKSLSTEPVAVVARADNEHVGEKWPSSDMDENFSMMSRADAITMRANEDAWTARCKRIGAQIDVGVKRDQFLPIAEIEAEIDEFIAAIVSGLEGVPGRFVQAFPAATTAMVDGLRRLIDDIRREIVGE